MATQDLSFKHQTFMTRYVAASQALRDARNAYLALRSEWDASAYSTVIVQADIPDVIGLGHLTPTVMANGFVSQANLETMWAAGNGTNIDAMCG